MQDIQQAIKELVQSQKEVSEQQKKTERQIKETAEQQKKTERQLEETSREVKSTSREVKATTQSVKRLDKLFTTQWGKLMEALVDGDLVKLLQGKGIDIERTMQNIKRGRGVDRREIDILAVNGTEVVAVEVKTTLKTRDVDRFIDRTLKNFVTICPEYSDKTIYGAVAFLKADQSADTYAEKQGLFVIRATGSSAGIVNEENFKPKGF